VATFIVAGWYFIVAAHRPRRSAAADLVIAGALLGLGLASKWAAAYTLGGVFVLSVGVTALAYERGRPGTGGPLDLLAGRGRNAALLFVSFVAVPLLIYLASYASWFGGKTAPYGWNLWELTQQMYWYHSSLTAPHCAGSPWWSWPLDLKPVYWYFGASGGGANGYIYDAGNIVLFWAALPAAALIVALAVRARSHSLALLSLAMLAQYLAWIPISRVLFFYHFFTVLPFYLLSLAAVLGGLWERRRKAVLVFVGIAAASFVIFYPYVSGLPIPGELGSLYAILPTWQYDPAFYPTDSCPTPVSAGALTSATVVAAWVIEAAVLIFAVAVAIGLPPARARRRCRRRRFRRRGRRRCRCHGLARRGRCGEGTRSRRRSRRDGARREEDRDRAADRHEDQEREHDECDRAARGARVRRRARGRVYEDGDVVLTAAGVREVDERVRRDAHVLTARRLRDLFGRDVARETVAAEQEPVGRTQALDVDVRLDATHVAGEARDRVRHLGSGTPGCRRGWR
ncbi:MAG: hypothetical protein DME05_02875, partial [Candidatus Rokuibacteriota bacterium]